jgi:UrcA family protein
MTKTIIGTALALSLAVIATPAAAETQSVNVSYADLNLDTSAGQAELNSRIDAAAGRICGKAEVRKVRDGVDHQRCLRETQASVSIEIARLTGRPMLARR